MISESLLSDFSRLVSNTLGLHFPKEGWEGFEKKLVEISRAFGFQNTADCLEWLMKAPLTQEQIATLAHYLTVGETYFFRDKHIFQGLQEMVLPELLRQKREVRSLRVWSAACCTGEEPYSISILLRQLIPQNEHWNISILGTDVNPRFIQKAETALYKEWSFRTTPATIKDNYFTKEADGKYRLHNEFRKNVQFTTLNLVEDVYPSLVNGTNAMDIIFCNNVLIYFTHEQIKKVLQKLTSALVEGGWLIVSAIEVPYVNDPRLAQVKWDDRTLFQKRSYQAAETPSYSQDPITITEPPLISSGRPFFREARLPVTPDILEPSSITICQELYQKGNYAEVVERLEKRLAQPMELEETKKALILLTKVYANQGKLQKAQEWCEKVIQIDKLDPSLYFMQATILQELNIKEGAAKSLSRALYLDQDFVMAHFALGSLLQAEGKKREAQRHFRNALQLLEKYRPDDVLTGDEGLSAGRLAEIIRSMQQEN